MLNIISKLPQLCISIKLKKVPLPFENYFTYISQPSNYLTRGVSAGAMQLPKFSISRLQQSFKFQGAKIWNSIPKEIKT